MTTYSGGESPGANLLHGATEVNNMGIRSTQYSAQELKKYGGKKILLFSGTVVADGNNRTNTTYPILNVMQFKEATFFLVCSELVGTPGTFKVDVDTKHPAGDYYEELTSFGTLGLIDQRMKTVSSCLGSHLAVRWTIVTFDSATFSVYGVFKIM